MALAFAHDQGDNSILFRTQFLQHADAFYSRDLDGDDYLLLDMIRERGRIACSSIGGVIDVDSPDARYWGHGPSRARLPRRFYVPHWKRRRWREAKAALLTFRSERLKAKRRRLAEKRQQKRRLELARQAQAYPPPPPVQNWVPSPELHDRMILKQRILNAITGSYPKVWTVDELMTATGCKDASLMIKSLQQLVDEQRMIRTQLG